MKIEINNTEYEVEKDYGDTVKGTPLDEIVTDYYQNFDYIVGDWAYGKVRLKGFYESNNKNVKSFNNIKNVDDYIKNSCAYGCKYFILKKCSSNAVEKQK